MSSHGIVASKGEAGQRKSVSQAVYTSAHCAVEVGADAAAAMC